nr:MAG TPA: hypothetical protein [Caudoviricetes sp.]
MIYIVLNRVLRHKTSSFITIRFEAPHSLRYQCVIVIVCEVITDKPFRVCQPELST